MFDACPFEVPTAYLFVEPAPVIATAAPKSPPKTPPGKAARGRKAPPPKAAAPKLKPEEMAPMGVIVTQLTQGNPQMRTVEGLDASPIPGGVIFHKTICSNLTCEYEAGYAENRDIRAPAFTTEGIPTEKLKIVAKSYQALSDAEKAIDFRLREGPRWPVLSIAALRELKKAGPKPPRE